MATQDNVDVVVAGAGFSGLYMVHKLREAVHFLERERDEARAAAAGVLAGGGAAGDATVRRDLPSVAVVVCPACGVDITADLDDGGAYVTRRHSRREPARVGLGDVVWCDGGLVRGAS